MGPGTVYAVSDIHGYRDDVAAGLRRAGLVDEQERWVGGDTRLWVLGDLVDRGPDGIGVVDLVMSLQRQAPEQVHVLMGNHEILALGRYRFPDSEFASSWRINGGRRGDQAGLTDEHVEWLAGLPVLGRAEQYLLAHSDTASYLGWGSTVEEVNGTVRDLLARKDFAGHWQVWSRLTSRMHFAYGGAAAAREVLDVLGGERIVHGHTIIGLLTGVPSATVQQPIAYADGLVVDIDGGRYDGGPLLVVRLV